MKGLLSDFPDPLIQKLRDQINEDSEIVFRPLDALLLKQPWYEGRVVLIGDAVHATTPHLASGACIGIEDGIVLAHSVATQATVAEALADFQSRRYERCRMVVENSLRLGEIEMTNGDKEEHQRIMGQSMGALTAPIL
jgi:2-polyprenyl-6-methoxyphenol hydroxylase-like FAD-dependent oxidoreductase